MENARDSLRDLESRRLKLEENVARLRAALRHWQTWELEYEEMKEEILGLPEKHSHAEIEKINATVTSTFDPSQRQLLTLEERSKILRDEKQRLRTQSQVVSVLDRRIEYVQQNVKTISSQLKNVENKLAASTIISNPEVLNEEGLPVTEIHEELDDDDNVISSSTSVPSETASNVIKEIESKAGERGTAKSDLVKMPATLGSSSASKSASGTTPIPKNSSSVTSTVKPSGPTKRVNFPADVNDEASPIPPPGDSPEEAALRQDMLRYNMEEIGAVVAEMHIDDDDDNDDNRSASDHGSGVDYRSASSEDEERSFSGDDASEEEDEDQYGRTTTRVLDADYIAQMRELEKKLNATALFNAGPEPVPSVDGSRSRERSELKSASGNNIKTDKPRPQTGKTVTKGVRFAPELDIQEAPEIIQRTNAGSKQPALASGDLEQTSDPGNGSPSSPPTAKKLSRFKAARAQGSPTDKFSPATSANQPNPPRPQIHSDRIIERLAPSSTPPPPSAPGGDEDFDPALLQQDIQREYHHLRNRQIQREGGFSKLEESAEVPLTPEEGGGRKVSRFKAARLGMQQQ